MKMTRNQKAVRQCKALHICIPITQLLMFIELLVYKYCSNTYIHLFWTWVFDHAFFGIAGSNSTGVMNVCLLCVLLGGGSCVGLITRPEESYRLWCVWV